MLTVARFHVVSFASSPINLSFRPLLSYSALLRPTLHLPSTRHLSPIVSNKPRSASPAPRIRGGLKHLWVTVDKEKLPQHVKDQIAESDKILAETTKAREEDLAQRRIAKRDRIAAARAQEKAEKAARAANAARVAKEIEAAKAGARA